MKGERKLEEGNRHKDGMTVVKREAISGRYRRGKERDGRNGINKKS